MSGFVSVEITEVRGSAYDANGYLKIQYQADGASPANVPGVEGYHPYGFWGRPADPDLDPNGTPKKAADCLVLREGDESYVLPLGDSRLIPGLSALRPGESLQYGPAFNFMRMHADGRVTTMTTTDGTANGQLVHSEVSPEGHVRKTPWAIERHDVEGIYYEHVSGALFHGGTMGGGPEPLASLAPSYFEFVSGTFTVKSSAVKLGSGGAYEPVAKALVALEVAAGQVGANTAVGLALSAAAAALAALAVDWQGQHGTPPPSAAPLIAANTVAAGAAAIGLAAANALAAAATTTLPARSVQVA